MKMPLGCCPDWRTGWWHYLCVPLGLWTKSQMPNPTASPAGLHQPTPSTCHSVRKRVTAQGHGGPWKGEQTPPAGCSRVAQSCLWNRWLNSWSSGGISHSQHQKDALHRASVGMSGRTSRDGRCDRESNWQSKGCRGWRPHPILGRRAPGRAPCWWSCPGPSSGWLCLQSTRASRSCLWGRRYEILGHCDLAASLSHCLSCPLHLPWKKWWKITWLYLILFLCSLI